MLLPVRAVRRHRLYHFLNTATAVLDGADCAGYGGEIDGVAHPFAMVVYMAASAAFMTLALPPVNTWFWGRETIAC